MEDFAFSALNLQPANPWKRQRDPLPTSDAVCIFKTLPEHVALHQLRRRAKSAESREVQETKLQPAGFRRGNPSAAEPPHALRHLGIFISKIPPFPPGNVIWGHLNGGQSMGSIFFAVNFDLFDINFCSFPHQVLSCLRKKSHLYQVQQGLYGLYFPHLSTGKVH